MAKPVGAMKLSDNTLERICKVFGYLNFLSSKGVGFVSSLELAKGIGATAYNVRKDFSLLGVTGYTRRGYPAEVLKQQLGQRLNLTKRRKACIVGLGRLGSALLDYEKFAEDGFEIVAGFDSSINKIERLRTNIELYSIDQLTKVVKERSIDLGIIAVPAKAVQEVADKLVAAGIKGILNFSPVKILVAKNIVHLDMDFTSALRFVAAKFSLQK